MPPGRHVHLVDDDEAVRDALSMLLRAHRLTVTAYRTAEAFLAACKPTLRGCLVLDVRMPGMSGLALQDALRERQVSLPIVFISAHGDVRTAVETMKKGAVEFVEKPFDDARLLAAVREALERDERTHAKGVLPTAVKVNLMSLTPRERQVLDCVLAGKTSRRIADELFISVKTVGFHRGRIMQKLHVSAFRELLSANLGGSAAAEPAARDDVS